MKTILIIFLSMAVLALFFFSCKKEFSLENGQASEGFLEKDISNNCLPATVNGNYVTGQKLDDNNNIEVQVHVTLRGIYSISTDTVNGYSFKATGNFKDTGSILVTLSGRGAPVTAGTNSFNVFYGTSSCQLTVTVLDSNPTAIFTLQGSPGNCMIDTIDGGYAKGNALDSNDQAGIVVNVTSPGTYHVSTDTINGYSFSASGTFISTGIQTIHLIASGVPVNAQTDVFTVHATSSTCTFPITVLVPVDITNDSHFPLTNNSYWVYDDLWHVGDTIKRSIIGDTATNNNSYKIMKEEKQLQAPVLSFFRYSNSDSTYYEYARVDKYTNSFQYNKDIMRDIPFLKEFLAKDAYWESDEYRDTATFGQVIIFKYTYKCIDNNAVVTINGKAFTNVYKIVVRPELKSEGNAYGYTGDVYTIYYAKGVGIIYLKDTANSFTQAEMQIRDWKVY